MVGAESLNIAPEESETWTSSLIEEDKQSRPLFVTAAASQIFVPAGTDFTAFRDRIFHFR